MCSQFLIFIIIALTATLGVTVASEDYHNTSLHIALQQGDLEAVKYFVTKKVDVNSIAEIGGCNCTTLVLAAKEGYVEIVKYLLDNNAHVNTKVIDLFSRYWGPGVKTNITPLAAAIYKGKTDVAKLLIEKGADIKEQDEEGFTHVHYAVQQGNLDVVRYLIRKGAEVNAKSGEGESALHRAALLNFADIARYLIENGANVNSEDNDGRTPLLVAAMAGSLETVDLLLSKGAENKATMPSGYTPLHYVVEFTSGNKDRSNMLNIFVKRRAIDLNVRTSNFMSQTALHLATDSGDLEAMKILLEAGVDANATDYLLRTPLHYVSQYQNLPACELLIQHGADVTLKDKYNETPLDKLSKKERLKIEKFIAKLKSL